MSEVPEDQERCCEIRRAVYDCPNCKHREYQEIEGTYTTEVCCENQPCYEGYPHPPDTFPSTAKLVGFRCPIHGWSMPPHLRQARMF